MLLEEMMRDEHKAGIAEGIAKGMAEGIAKGRIEGKTDLTVEVVRQNKAKGRTVAEIAEFLNEDIDKISAIYDTCEAAPTATQEEQ